MPVLVSRRQTPLWSLAKPRLPNFDVVPGRVSSTMQEIAESTAEEAQKKLKDLNLHEKVGAGTPQQAVGLAFSLLRVLRVFREVVSCSKPS